MANGSLVLVPVLSALLSATPAVGDVAPDFSVTDTDGVTRTLSELVKDGTAIIAFFPKAFTPG